MKKNLSRLFAACVLLASAFLPVGALAATYKTVSGTFRYGYAQQVLTLVNQQRQAYGLEPLIMTQNLTDAAMKRAAECVVHWDPYEHIRPNGQACYTAWDWDGHTAENIQKGAATPAAVVNAWMNSPLHRKNILSSQDGFIGIGCFQCNGTLYWTQAFSASTTSATDTRSSNLSATVKVSQTSGVDSIVTIGGGGGGGETTSSYKVRFVRNYGSGGSVLVQTISRNKATQLAANRFSRSGYLFLGWAKTSNGGVAYKNGQTVKNLAAAGGTVTLYARWAKQYCKAVFHSNDGRGRTYSQKLPYGKVTRLAKNRFSVKGYVFLGWATSSGGKVSYNNRAKVKNNRASGAAVHFYARWAKRTGKIVFKANGGKGRMAAQKVVYGKPTVLRKNAFKRKGYRFAGWATRPNGPVQGGDRASITYWETDGRTVTLYARWARARTAPAKKGAAKADEAAPVTVTASCGGDASAVADGDETTSWTPDTADGSWVVLTFDGVRDVEDVEVVGGNLPEGTRFLVSEDAEGWTETLPARGAYVWVVFPASEEAPTVNEILVAP